MILYIEFLGLFMKQKKCRSSRQRFMASVPEELWTEVCDIVQGAVIKSIPKKRKCKLPDKSLQIA